MPLLQNRHTRRLELIPKAFYLGFISLSVQVVYARLAVSFAGGNEVYLSLFYFFWLLFTGAGALLIKRFRPDKLFPTFGTVFILFSLPYYLAPKVFGILPGQLNPPHIYILTLVMTLLPVGIINGALFGSIARSIAGNLKSSKTYWGEAFGALFAGIVTAIYYFSGGRDLTFLIFIFAVSFVTILKNLRFKIIVLALGICVCLFHLGDGLENQLLKIRYSPFAFQGSVSGRLIRYDSLKTGGIITLFSGGGKIADFPDEISGQEIFYWSYLLKPDAGSALLIGAETQMVDKYIPDNIQRLYIYPENSWHKLVPSKYIPAPKHVHLVDPPAYLKQVERKFDIIIINTGELLSLYDNRLETEHIFGLCRRALGKDGLLSVIVPAYDGIWQDDLKRRLNEIYGKLNTVFENVQYIPGDNMTFICSPGVDIEPTSMLLISRLDSLHINSAYFNPALIRSRLNDFKMEMVNNQLNIPVAKSSPLSIGHGLSYYFSKFKIKPGLQKYLSLTTLLIIAAFFSVLIALLSRFDYRRTVSLINILSFGAFSFIIELMAIYYIQLSGGYLYIALGIIVGLFMAGMASGALAGIYFSEKIKNLPNSIHNGALISIIVFVISGFLILIGHNVSSILLIAVTLAGFAGGFGFSACAGLFDNAPGLPYGIDLGGALIGTLAGIGILISAIQINEFLPILLIFGMILFATNIGLRSKQV
jgi:hypothetical protein